MVWNSISMDGKAGKGEKRAPKREEKKHERETNSKRLDGSTDNQSGLSSHENIKAFKAVHWSNTRVLGTKTSSVIENSGHFEEFDSQSEPTPERFNC